MGKRRKKTVKRAIAAPRDPAVPSVQLETIRGHVIRDVVVSTDPVVTRRVAVERTIREPLAVEAQWNDPDDKNERSKTPRQVIGKRRSDPLMMLLNRRDSSVTKHHMAAAERYRADYEVGELGARPDQTVGFASVSAGSPGGPTQVRLDALKRYRDAKRALGRSSAGLLHTVLIERIDITTNAEERGISRHVAMGMLIAALNRLEEHYAGAASAHAAVISA
jgi:hypothetical protein